MKLFKRRKNLEYVIHHTKMNLEIAKRTRENYLKSVQSETDEFMKKITNGDKISCYDVIEIASSWNFIKELSIRINDLEELLDKLTRA